MDLISFKPIGIIHSPFKKPTGTPIQTSAAKGIEGHIEIFPEYLKGLQDLDGFSHIILIFYFHLSHHKPLLVKPYLDSELRGVFATRSPNRPNPIGLSIVQLKKIEGNILHIEDVDMVEGTPLLDIKPYIPAVDVKDARRIGWLKNKSKGFENTRDDGHFNKEPD